MFQGRSKEKNMPIPRSQTHIQTDQQARRTARHETHPGYSSVASTRAEKCLLEIALRLVTDRTLREATFIIAQLQLLVQLKHERSIGCSSCVVCGDDERQQRFGMTFARQEIEGTTPHLLEIRICRYIPDSNGAAAHKPLFEFEARHKQQRRT